MTFVPRLMRIFAISSLLPLIASSALAAEIDFSDDIRPILSDKCFFCHGPDEHERKAGLRLDTEAGATADNDGVVAVNRANPELSELLFRLETDDLDELMPPPKSHKTLAKREIQLLKDWIAIGAPWEEHWAFEAPKKSSEKATIDEFIGERLEDNGLWFSDEADKRTLIRRVTLDLHGLPPAPNEVEDFLKNDSPDAYEQVVDRLLKSPRYAERMTLAWMDAARYGDSSVMHADGPRSMWPWRDWVLNAYDTNMPFDQFTTEQLAGDLIPDATVDQRIASGFNRNHASSDEGGAIPEELRVDYVVDRVQTTANVWLALSVECSQCHDHKYDPISQKEYFQFFAFFNNTQDPGMQTRKGNQAPVVNVPDEARDTQIATLVKAISHSDDLMEAHRVTHAAMFGKWAAEAASKTKSEPGKSIDGLEIAFDLDEKDGKTLAEVVAGKTATLASGKFQAGDRGIQFDGKTAFNLEALAPWKTTEPLTFATWIKIDKGAGGAVFGRMDESKGHRGFDLWIEGRGIGTHIIDTWSGDALKVISADKLTYGKWQHVVVTYDGSQKASGVKIYLDGKLAKNSVKNDALKGEGLTTGTARLGGRSRSLGKNFSIDDFKVYRRQISAEEVPLTKLPPIDGILSTPEADRSPDQKKTLEQHYFSAVDPAYQKLANSREKQISDKAKLEANPVTSMVMADNAPDKMRMTYILDRGQYDAPKEDEAISPGTPLSLGSMPEGAPQNRLGLAQWLTQPDHPLTARVAINRYWAMFFGEGIVRTLADFGSQGAIPSHPELLDSLAVDFVQSGWDVKDMIRRMVTSRTYRQSSVLRPELTEADPENLLLGRSGRFRLQGEFVRDQALAVSGLLVERVGGPGVKPYQPINIWNEVSLGGGVKYVQDSGDALYRRSMYTYWKRSAPMPSMLIFDAPTREKCTLQRPRTNTPLQALVTLNDPQFVEAARVLAERLIHETGEVEAERINRAFELAVSRPATDREIAILRDVLKEQFYIFEQNPERAKTYLAIGESPRDEAIDPIEHAAWSVVTQMILNLDETLTRG